MAEKWPAIYVTGLVSETEGERGENGRPHATITRMANRSSDKTASVRVPADEYAAAESALPDGWTVPQFLAACLIALGEDPVATLALVMPRRPHRPPRGRPRKAAATPHSPPA